MDERPCRRRKVRPLGRAGGFDSHRHPSASCLRPRRTTSSSQEARILKLTFGRPRPCLLVLRYHRRASARMTETRWTSTRTTNVKDGVRISDYFLKHVLSRSLVHEDRCTCVCPLLNLSLSLPYMRKTPKPFLSPSHVVTPPADEPGSRRSREDRASARPRVSRVSTGLMIPSSHRRAEAYSAVDCSSISSLSVECLVGSLYKR